ncbi:MAG: hypothetical protein ABWY68_10615, partial [Cryobacterium sp.]
QEDSVTPDVAATICPTCGLARSPEEFYATSAECRPCKRQRSQQNRSSAAQKVALVDRLLAVLERLAEQGWQPDTLIAGYRPNAERPPAVLEHQPEASTEPQEVRP